MGVATNSPRPSAYFATRDCFYPRERQSLCRIGMEQGGGRTEDTDAGRQEGEIYETILRRMPKKFPVGFLGREQRRRDF